MSNKSIAQKMTIKEGRKVLVVNAPKGYKEKMGPLPAGTKILAKSGGPADVIQLFVADRKELEEQLPRLKTMLPPDGMLWVSYLKGTSKTKTDINRDSLHAYAKTIGLEGVAMISIDDDWSAMRFKVKGE